MYSKAVNKKVLCLYVFLLLPGLNTLAAVNVHNLPGIYSSDQPELRLSGDETARIELVTPVDQDVHLDDTPPPELIVVTFLKSEEGAAPFLSQMDLETVPVSETLRGRHATIAVLSTHPQAAKGDASKGVIVLSLLFPSSHQQKTGTGVLIADEFSQPVVPVRIFPSYIRENVIVTKELASQLIAKGVQGSLSQNAGGVTTLVDLRDVSHDHPVALAVSDSTPYIPDTSALEREGTYPIILLSGEKQQSGTESRSLRNRSELDRRNDGVRLTLVSGEGSRYSKVVLSRSPAPSSGYSSPVTAHHQPNQRQTVSSTAPIDINNTGRHLTVRGENYQYPPRAHASSYSSSSGSHFTGSLERIREGHPLEHVDTGHDSAVSSLTGRMDHIAIRQPNHTARGAAIERAQNNYVNCYIGANLWEDGALALMDSDGDDGALSGGMSPGAPTCCSGASSSADLPYQASKSGPWTESTKSFPVASVSPSPSPALLPISNLNGNGTCASSAPLQAGSATDEGYDPYTKMASRLGSSSSGGHYDRLEPKKLKHSASFSQSAGPHKKKTHFSSMRHTQNRAHTLGRSYSKSAPDAIVTDGGEGHYMTLQESGSYDIAGAHWRDTEGERVKLTEWIGVPPPFITKAVNTIRTYDYIWVDQLESGGWKCDKGFSANEAYAWQKFADQQLSHEFSGTAPFFSESEYECEGDTCAGEFTRMVLLDFLAEKNAAILENKSRRGNQTQILGWVKNAIENISNSSLDWSSESLQNFISGQLRLMAHCRSFHEFKTLLYGIYDLAYDHLELISQQITYVGSYDFRHPLVIQGMDSLAEEAKRIGAGFEQKDPVMMASNLAPNNNKNQGSLDRFRIRSGHIEKYARTGNITSYVLHGLPGVNGPEDCLTTVGKVRGYIGDVMPWLFISDCLQSVNYFESLLGQISGAYELEWSRRERAAMVPTPETYVYDVSELFLLARLLKYKLVPENVPAVRLLIKQVLAGSSGRQFLTVRPAFREFIEMFLVPGSDGIKLSDLKVARAMGQAAIGNALRAINLRRAFTVEPEERALKEDHQLNIEMVLRVVEAAKQNKMFIESNFRGTPPPALVTSYLMDMITTVSAYQRESFILHAKSKPGVIKKIKNKDKPKSQIIHELDSALLGSECLLWTRMSATLQSASLSGK